MATTLFRNVILSTALTCLTGVISACGSSVQGTYANDTVGIALELKSGGQARFTSSLGDADVCAYTVEGRKITLDCKHDKVIFTIGDDGSLTAPFLGTLRKTK